MDAPPWLDSETRPIVLVTASTAYQRDDKLIATAVEALADERVAVVATTGALDPRADANAYASASRRRQPGQRLDRRRSGVRPERPP